MKIKIKKLRPNAKMPQYTIEGDAAMELYSSQNLSIKPGERVACETGIAMSIPNGFVGLIWDKSGIALKGGMKTMGGVIDSNFRGEIGVIMKNLSDKDYEIKEGDKIAQMIIQKIEVPELEETDVLDETERGEGGFGSTGIR